MIRHRLTVLLVLAGLAALPACASAPSSGRMNPGPGDTPALERVTAAMAEAARLTYPRVRVDGNALQTGWRSDNRLPGTVLPRTRRRAEARAEQVGPDEVLVEVRVHRETRRSRRPLLYTGWAGHHWWWDDGRDEDWERDFLDAVRDAVESGAAPAGDDMERDNPYEPPGE